MQSSPLTKLQLSGISRLVRAEQTHYSNRALLGTGTRRVHGDGIVMLDQNLSLKDSDQKIAIMQSRVKRLLFEEQRARKLSQVA